MQHHIVAKHICAEEASTIHSMEEERKQSISLAALPQLYIGHILHQTTATSMDSFYFAGVFLIKKLQNFLSLSAKKVMSLATHEHLSQSHKGEGGACT